MMTMKVEKRRSLLSHSLSRAISLLSFALSGILIVTYHVCAEEEEQGGGRSGGAESKEPTATTTNTTNVWERLRNGPEALKQTDYILFTVLMLLAFELLDFITKNSGKWLHSKLIPVRGKHLDDLTSKDILFIGISKAATAPFVYFYLRYAYYEPNILWHYSQMTITNTLVPIIPMFIIYDFFYTILHWALHIKCIYGWIHKHHHHQKAPSRANVDAVNVHPIEFFLGEYNHLMTIFLYARFWKLGQIHVVTCLAFLIIGGLLAGINHTRYDIVFGLNEKYKIYDSKAHDVHHRFPQSNYGQYIMLWDIILGSYRAYDPNDSINPKSQLDPKTGKSYAHAASAASSPAGSGSTSSNGHQTKTTTRNKQE